MNQETEKRLTAVLMALGRLVDRLDDIPPDELENLDESLSTMRRGIQGVRDRRQDQKDQPDTPKPK